MFFIWRRDTLTARAVPCIADELPIDAARGKPRPVLASHKISDDESKMPFSVLERLYPAPLVLALFLVLQPAIARDNADWRDVSPERSAWFERLMQPPNPRVSCCADADAYESDNFDVADDGDIIAIITDGTADPEHGKPEIPNGTRIKVPARKVVIEPEQVRTNPTGHGWLFYRKSDDFIFCYVLPSGF